jgi:TRAP-type mannitol/chloroaromatic compound transport system substrate-binding protein
MNYYERFSPDVLNNLKSLNDELLKEQKQMEPDNKKILRLKQQILMKGLEMSTGMNNRNYNIF